MNSTELQVEGMSCGSCVKHINAALQPLAGVGEVTVDLASGRVKVTGDTQSDVLLSALKEAGYPASVLTEDKHESVKKKSGCGGSSCCCH
ncbi:copper chaperone CopZ [Pseudomonas sp. 478]|jgi:copper chaperone|uniref:heavy-metal-associated domain-containing protein n=1 Tax=unclassified Pseudomonas TaxID=196821 RepID=UPI000DAF3687|nr:MULTISPECIES: heavy metal-associated domain-containing protein [unclassified Pseudomonas]MBD9599286.1 heavy-metal-associated domain-containing protein [Pseudomonas sp. PDM10]MBV7512920.1 heavy-metal-associated domain-containing protein [Pseudomonas sp. PDM25]PZW95264.1 copper chaperone CopZ [Pseudomonas sp. 478]TCV50861.1 copper chaperone CopZ [Pseudomonas sp. 460]